VLKAGAEVFEIELSPDLLKIGGCFSGGIGYSGCLCGALTGALFLVGLIFGEEGPRAKKKKALEMSRQMHDAFRERFKSTCCRVVRQGLSFDDKALKVHCRQVTADTAVILMGLLDATRSV
jgi:C_GCAxxG_C_C family probable redox protein